MARQYEQFYRTWCYSGRSVDGSDGWKIRAKSDGLALQEAEGMADFANYWSPTEPADDKPPGRRLALFRQANQTILAHGVLISKLVGGRTGVSFEHVIVGLPQDFSAFDAIKLWRSSAWHTEDHLQTPIQLEPFILTEEGLHADFKVPEPGNPPLEDRDGAVAVRFLGEPKVLRWADFVLRACLALFTKKIDKFYVAGSDDTIAHLLFVSFYCLPNRLRCKLTFSTHENPKGTKGVEIVGVTTFEGDESDLAPYSYSGRYCALNTFNGAKTEGLLTSLFADSAIQWVLCGQHSLLSQARQRFDALDVTDNPTLEDLDLLTEFSALPSDAATVSRGLLKLCGSPAIGRWMVQDFEQLSSLVRAAQSNFTFRRELVFQLASWLPRHEQAAQEFPAGLARIALEQLRNGSSFQEFQWLEDFAKTVGIELTASYWEQLLILCQSPSSRELLTNITAPLETRLKLLVVWQQKCGLGVLDRLAESWLRIRTDDLVGVLQSGLKVEFKQQALGLCLESANGNDFAAMIGQLRQNEDFQKNFIAVWSGSDGDKVDFSARLANFGVEHLRSGHSFEDVAWIGSFAGQLAPALASQFWQHFWKDVSPNEFVEAISGKLPNHLKQQAVQFFFQTGKLIDAQITEIVFKIISENTSLARHVFLNLPTWNANTVPLINNIQDTCLAILLNSMSQSVRPSDLSTEAWVRAVDSWSARRNNLIPDRMKTMITVAHAANALPGTQESHYVESYKKLNGPEDAEFRKLIIQSLFCLTERQPTRLRTIIKTFAEGDDNFATQFLPVFQTSILEWQYQRKDGTIAGEYLNFCLSVDFEKICKGHCKEGKAARQQFIDSVLLSFSAEAKQSLDRAAATWNSESRKQWAIETNAKPWWRKSAVLTVTCATVAIIGLLILWRHHSTLMLWWNSVYSWISSHFPRLHSPKAQS